MMAQSTGNSNAGVFPEIPKESCSVQLKLDGLIDHLNAVVSIGTSNDEEEVLVSSHVEASDITSEAVENRNDVETTSGTNGYEEIATAVLACRDAVDAHGFTEREGNEDRTHTQIDGSDRIKFGAHMIRDSVIADESTWLLGQEDCLVSEPAEEKGNRCQASEQSKNESNTQQLRDDESANHQLGMMSDSESLYTGNQTSNQSTEQEPLKSILKKTDDKPMTPKKSRHLRLFGQHKLEVSPKLRPFIRKQRGVTFSSIQLRTYYITLGDHPNCKFGAPISISWEYHQCNDMSVNLYEQCRGERRKMKKLYLNSSCRRKLLKRAGFSIEEISDAINEVQLIRLMRQESVEETNDTPAFVAQTANCTTLQQPHNMNWGAKKISTWTRIKGMLPGKKSKF